MNITKGTVIVHHCFGGDQRYSGVYLAEHYLDWLENHPELHKDCCNFAKGAR